MDKFIPKFNLYETLAMLIPGATILYVVSVSSSINTYTLETKGFNENMVHTIMFLVLSYLIGVLLHSIMNCIFGFLRNNAVILWYSINNLEIEKCHYHYIEELLKGIEKTNSFRFYKMFFKAICPKSEKKNISLIDKYYEAYYYVFSKDWGGSIASIERQIHFIRNMFIPLQLLILCYSIIGKVDWWKICISIIVFLIISILLMVERQQKVHKRVFEDYEYLKRLESTNTSVNNPTNNNTPEACPDKCSEKRCFDRLREALKQVP